MAMVMTRTEKAAATEAAEPRGGGAPVTSVDEGPSAGAGEEGLPAGASVGGVEEVTLMASFWPRSQWPVKAQAK